MSETGRDPREGVLERAGERWRLRFQRRLPHDRAKVWRALTEERHLAAWFPTTIEGELKPGAPLRFRFRDGDYPSEEGRVLACEPPTLLEFEWHTTGDDGAPQYETSRFEIEEDGDGCVLTFLATYDLLGKSARDAAGWHVCFDLLEHGLAGTAPPSDEQPWEPLSALYTERFGPDAATVGPPPQVSQDQADRAEA